MEDLLKAQHRELNRLRGSELATAERILQEALRSTKKKLLRTRMASWDASSLQLVQAQLRDALATLRDRQRKALDATLPQVSELSWKHTSNVLRSLDKRFQGVVRPLGFDNLSWLSTNTRQLSQIRLQQYRRSFARYGAVTVRAVEDEIARVVTLGEKWTSARQKVWSATRHVVEDNQWMVDRIIRTETSAMYNGTRLAALVEEDHPEDPMYKRLIATFDERTGQDSKLVHGQIRPVHKPFLDVLRGRTYMAPPNRPNDREVIVGWRASYAAYNGPESVSVPNAPAEIVSERLQKLRRERLKNKRRMRSADGAMASVFQRRDSELDGEIRELEYLLNPSAETVGPSPAIIAVLLRVYAGKPVRRSGPVLSAVQKGFVRQNRTNGVLHLSLTPLGQAIVENVLRS